MRKEYIKKNWKHITDVCRKYNKAHKEEIAEYKRKWAAEQKEKNADKIAKEREEKRNICQQKSNERIAKVREIYTCECGGTYQFYQKKRHMESKKHLSFYI